MDVAWIGHGWKSHQGNSQGRDEKRTMGVGLNRIISNNDGFLLDSGITNDDPCHQYCKGEVGKGLARWNKIKMQDSWPRETRVFYS